MKALGYDDVRVDGMGNLVGRVGQGGRKLLFDSHTDTVAVTDPERWSVEPFAGTVRDGMLYGRGAVDMKSAIAASVYAGAAAKRLGLSEGKPCTSDLRHGGGLRRRGSRLRVRRGRARSRLRRHLRTLLLPGLLRAEGQSHAADRRPRGERPTGARPKWATIPSTRRPTF